MPLPTSTVSKAQAGKLNYANTIISKVRAKMPYGAGNLAVDIDRTGGASIARTARVYEAYDTVTKELKPKLLAGIAEKYGAGNCDMAGAMAYTMMRGMLSSKFEVMYIRGEGHTYAAFKDAEADDSTAIIVDPWPTSGMATLAEHHFMGFHGNPTILRKRGKFSGEVLDRVALNDKYAELTAKIDADLKDVSKLPSATFPAYTNLLCSTQVGGYQGPDGKSVPLPVERMMLPPPPIPVADANADVAMEDVIPVANANVLMEDV